MEHYPATTRILFNNVPFKPRVSRWRSTLQTGHQLRTPAYGLRQHYEPSGQKGRTYCSIIMCTGVSYEFIRRLMVIELSPAERTAFAMSCKSLMRDAFYLTAGGSLGYVPILNRKNAMYMPGKEYDHWLALYEVDVILKGLVHCAGCHILHDPKKVYRAPRPPPSGVSSSRKNALTAPCAQPMVQPIYLHPLNHRFHPLVLYWVYQDKLTRRDFSATPFESSDLTNFIAPQHIASENRDWAEPRVHSLRHGARITTEGIFLRETQQLILPRPTREFQKRFPLCLHYYVNILTMGEGAFHRGPLDFPAMGGNYLITFGFTAPTAYETRNDQCLLLQLGLQNSHSGQVPFNHLYSCSVCNRDFLLETISPQAGIADMSGGLKITTWSCVAWYQQRPDRSRPNLSPQQIASAFREPHLREETNSMQGLRPGTSATIFEGRGMVAGIASAAP